MERRGGWRGGKGGGEGTSPPNRLSGYATEHMGMALLLLEYRRTHVNGAVVSDFLPSFFLQLITRRICPKSSSAGILFTHGPIFGFFAPQGRHAPPIKVKFGMQ